MKSRYTCWSTRSTGRMEFLCSCSHWTTYQRLPAAQSITSAFYGSLSAIKASYGRTHDLHLFWWARGGPTFADCWNLCCSRHQWPRCYASRTSHSHRFHSQCHLSPRHLRLRRQPYCWLHLCSTAATATAGQWRSRAEGYRGSCGFHARRGSSPFPCCLWLNAADSRLITASWFLMAL